MEQVRTKYRLERERTELCGAGEYKEQTRERGQSSVEQVRTKNRLEREQSSVEQVRTKNRLERGLSSVEQVRTD